MHTDPDVLALLALGEAAGTPDDATHVLGCLGCRAELAELTRIVQIGQHHDVEIAPLVEPPSRVWDGVRSELGLARAQAVADRPLAPVTLLRPRRRRAQLVLAAAAALVAVLGAGSVLQHGDVPTAAPAIKATMNAMPKWPGTSGVAQVEQDASGQRTLVISLSSPMDLKGEQEVWISDTRAEHMQSMGYLTNGQGRFPLPATLDLKSSPVVDVSDEPINDRDAHHSGDSIVRCRLPV